MVPVTRLISLCFALTAVCLACSSCTSMNPFKKEPVSAEAVQPNPDPVPAATDATANPAPETDISIEELRRELAEKDTAIHTLENKVELLEQKITGLEARDREPRTYNLAYTEPSQLYKEARRLLLADDFVNAAQLFNRFAEGHPDHSLADNALYWLGECYYSLGQYQTAVQEFKRLVKTYPRAEKVPDALLKTGYAYLSLDDVNRGNHYLKQVLKKYPFSPAAEKAQEKLKDIQ